jgi:hypothetical protein
MVKTPADSATAQQSSVVKQHHRRPPSRLGMSGTAGSFQPNDPRINRSGRPRSGTAFSEIGRERISPEKVLELAERVINDESISPRERLAAVMPVIDRIYVRPPTQLEASLSPGPASDYNVDRLSTDEKRELLASIRRLKAGGADADQPAPVPAQRSDG